MTDSIAAHCLDATVLWFGLTVEAALAERVNKGTPKEPTWEQRYTLTQLLDPIFRVPRPAPEPKPSATPGGFATLMALAGQKGSGVKLWTGKPS